jgi:Cu2+-exporting ATPase
MLVIGGLIIGGLLYTGIRSRKVSNDKKINSRKKTPSEKNLSIATTSLGCIVSGPIFFAPLTLLGVGGLVYLVLPTWKQAYNDLTRKRRFTRMVLESMVLPGTILTGHFFAAAIAYWFLYFSLNIVSKAKGLTTKNLAEVFITPSNRVVYLMREGVELEFTLKDVQAGDVLVVEAGEIIPVDGTIVEGNAAIDQRMLTGESQLVEKQVGDFVFASTMMLTGRILIEVEKAGEETISNQTQQILNEMTSFTATLELRSIDMADRLALPYLMLGSAASVLKGTSSGLAIFWSPLDDALYAVGPLSVLNYLNIALRRGILVKDGRALEILRKVDTIVFDKTGTLTEEIPKVAKIHACGEVSQSQILRYAGAAERKHTHPVAQAILEEVLMQDIKLPSIQEAAYETGYGIKVMIGEQTVLVGSLRFMEQQSLSLPEQLEAVQIESQELGESLVYVAIDEAIVGAIELHARIRPNTVEVISKLKALGYNICIISGDHEKPTQHLAKQLGIEHYFAETLPEEKANLIKNMQQEGRVVCYIGDGINDTIALKQAEVSVSLRGASSIATDTAQVVLMNGQLDQLIELIELAKQLDVNLKNTFLVSVIPTAAIVGGVLIFNLSLTAAIIVYMVSMGLSVTNAVFPLLKEK